MVHCPGCQNKQKAAQSARWSDLRFLIKAATAVLSSPPKYLPNPPCLTVTLIFGYPWYQTIANTHQQFISCFKCGGPSQPNFTHSYCSSLSAVQEVNLDISFSGPHFSFQNLLVSYRILVSRQNLGVSSDTTQAPNFFCLNVLKIR